MSPKASLTASPSGKARSAIVTARSPSESPRIGIAKSLLTVETETKTETKTKTKAAAMWTNWPTDAIVKIALVAVQMHHLSAGTAGTRAVAAQILSQ